MIKYTCGFMFDKDNRMILVEKLKPAWQAYKMNGVGGRNERGETQLECMCREWKEETGDGTTDWEQVLNLKFDDCIVSFYRCRVHEFPTISKVTDTGERLCIFDSLPENTIDNLKWIVPLMLDDHAKGLTTTRIL